MTGGRHEFKGARLIITIGITALALFLMAGGAGAATPTVDDSSGVMERYLFKTQNGLLESLTIMNTSSIITNRTATITWVTNNFSDSTVKFGLSPKNYTFIKHINDNVISHTITLTNLTPDTNYYFMVNSTDTTGSIQSQERVFWTPYDNFPGNLNIINIEIKQLTNYEEKQIRLFGLMIRYFMLQIDQEI